MDLVEAIIDQPVLIDMLTAKLQQATPQTPEKVHVKNPSSQLNERSLENHDDNEEQKQVEKQEQYEAEAQGQIDNQQEVHQETIKQVQKSTHELIEEPIQRHIRHVPIKEHTEQVISSHSQSLANMLIEHTFPVEKTKQATVKQKAKNIQEVKPNQYSSTSAMPNFLASTLVQRTIPEPKRSEKSKKAKTAQTLQSNKCLYLIFSHFCKENYLSSIKSTLFEDKKKSMEEMPLNKWMVFCKQFDVFTKLCSLKIQKRKSSGEEVHNATMENSRVKQQLKVKETKQVEKILGQIFKKAAQNHTKMEYHHFLQAVKMLNEEFKRCNEQLKEQSDLQFAKKYLYCQVEHECMHKLSNLKFTFAIPQIDYSKVFATPMLRQKSRSKFNTYDMKQNVGEEAQIPRKKTKGTLEEHSKTMNLNPIIKDAKNTMTNAENKVTLTTHRKPGSKIKLTLDQQKSGKLKRPGKQEEVNELLAYFDSTNDEILQSYFKGQKMLTAVQKPK